MALTATRRVGGKERKGRGGKGKGGKEKGEREWRGEGSWNRAAGWLRQALNLTCVLADKSKLANVMNTLGL